MAGGACDSPYANKATCAADEAARRKRLSGEKPAMAAKPKGEPPSVMGGIRRALRPGVRLRELEKKYGL